MPTYTIRIKAGDVWDLEDPDGKKILTDQSLPVTTPNDVQDHAIANELNRHGCTDDDTKTPSSGSVHRAIRYIQSIRFETVDER